MHEIAALHPRDGYNRVLEANVHPPDWINPKPACRYNLVVVGAGIFRLGWLPPQARRAWS